MLTMDDHDQPCFPWVTTINHANHKENYRKWFEYISL